MGVLPFLPHKVTHRVIDVLAKPTTFAPPSLSGMAAFRLFEDLVRNGTTVVMVTHDTDLAKRVTSVVLSIAVGVFAIGMVGGARGRSRS